jgi:hypothetical protein
VGLAEELIARPQRENAGARSRNRSGYQESWSLCKLLELHQEAADYLLILEYHDDVICLDSATHPTGVAFFQVKTRKSGHWTRTQLTARKKKKPSVLGLLYGGFLTFPQACTGLNLVSNFRFDLDLADGSDSKQRPRICLDEVEPGELAKLQDSLKKELELQVLHGGINLTFLEVSSLAVDDHENHALGRLASFLNKHHPKCEPLLNSLFRALQAEVRRRSSREEMPADFAALATTHGVSRVQFDGMLAQAESLGPQGNLPDRIESRLNSEGVAAGVVVRLKRAVRQYLAERLNPERAFLDELQVAIAARVAKAESESLKQAMEVVMSAGDETIAKASPTFGDVYIRAMILVAIYDQEDDSNELSPTGAPSPDKEE